MRWIRISTRERGWRREVLMHGAHIVGSVDTFWYASYGNVLGERTGSIRGRRKAKRVVRKRLRALVRSGLSLDTLEMDGTHQCAP